MASSVNSNAVLCVKGEIHNVLTVLRLNSRWASRERFTKEVPLEAESPLSRAFKGLHSYLEEVDDLASVDTVRYLLPFLAVVESPATTGPMTGVALSSLHKFLLYGFIRKECPRVKEAISLVAQAISRCHFEETDPESDEVVLMKLLELSAQCLRCEVGDLLEDESCWVVFRACYKLYRFATDDRASVLLRDTAGNTLANVVLMLFSRPRLDRANVRSAAAVTINGSGPRAREERLNSGAPSASPAERADKSRALSGDAATVNGGGVSAVGELPRPAADSPRSSQAVPMSDGLEPPGDQDKRTRSVAFGPMRVLHEDAEEEPWPSVESEEGNLNVRLGPGEDGDGTGEPGQVQSNARNGRCNEEGKEVSEGKVATGGGDAAAGRSGDGGGGGGGDNDESDETVNREEGVLVSVMRFLSRLSDPRANGRAECVLGLRLINVALEAGGADLGRIPALVRVMRGDLCKHLLQNSQTADLNVLSLTLRVVFNLFNSIKDHLKIQLEVFLTSVHLRVLDGASNDPEQQELALESLLEFTREPALMADVYINYDCDVQCTNLFETICHALSSHALPRDGMEVNALNRLALEGVLAVIDSISRRCQASPPGSSRALPNVSSPSSYVASQREARLKPSTSAGSSPGQDPTRTPENTSVTDSDSDLDSLGNASGHGHAWTGSFGGSGFPAFAGDGVGGDGGAAGVGAVGLGVEWRGAGGDSSRGREGRDGNALGAGDELGWLERARARTAEVLQERKKMKRRLGLAADRFNSGSKEWLEYAQELGLIPTPATAEATARFLKGTVMLDRSMLGEYLSRGPADKYPFHAQVLEEYVKLFDMRDKTFVEALRAFLKEFRLPGEAQCIDRLMEAFAGQQYRQGLGSGRHPFVNGDAAFTMAFSAIMLNTDLHNPQVPDHRRMSLDDFIRNNRQINGGKDLPREFLEGIYKSIKEQEIQVHRDHVSMVADGLGIDYTQHWDGILNRSKSVASASFTPARAARKHLFTAGVHERDMLLSITRPASKAMRAVFMRTRDDLLVLGCLRGFRSHARACVYLGLLEPFDNDLVFFFKRGLEYASAAAEGSAGPPIPEVLKNPGFPCVADVSASAPFASGCVVHRDLLALKCGLELARAYAQCVSSAWGPLLECVFALADLQVLPSSVTDVDDFGDAQGNPLPPSIFARRCRDQVRSSQMALLSQAGGARASSTLGVAHVNGAGGSGGGGLWGSLSGVLFSRAGEGTAGRRGGAAAEASMAAMAEDPPVHDSQTRIPIFLVVEFHYVPKQEVVRTVQLEHLFSQTKDLPLEAVERLLGALLSSRDPATPRHPPTSPGNDASGVVGGNPSRGGGNTLERGEGRAWVGSAAASFEAHAVLALELSSRVVLANRHRVSRLWPSLHSFLARVLGGEGSLTMTRLPFLVERAMVTVLRACIHMLDRKDMEELLLRSLRLLLALPAELVLPLSNRLASGLLILIQANASALSALSTAGQWEVIGALMSMAVAADGGRGFVLEALTFMVKRGLGLLGRHNVVMAHELLCKFAFGRFGDNKPDFAWILPACASLEGMTFTVLEGLVDPDPDVNSSLAGPRVGGSSGRCSEGSSLTSTAATVPEGTGIEPEESKAQQGGSGQSSGGLSTGGSLQEVAYSVRGGERTDPPSLGGAFERGEAERLWLSTLHVLGPLVGSPFARVSRGAAEALERLVLEVHGIRAECWGEAFASVLLKLPVRLLPPSSKQRSDGDRVQGTSNEEVCLRCCKILSRSFLHHLQALASLPNFGKLWLESIRLLSLNLKETGAGHGDSAAGDAAVRGDGGRAGSADRGAGPSSETAESCQQFLTNMVMVAAHMGLLGGPNASGNSGAGDSSGVRRESRGGGSSDPERLLYLTGQILDPVCPGLQPLLRGLAGDSDFLAHDPPSEPRGGVEREGNGGSDARRDARSRPAQAPSEGGEMELSGEGEGLGEAAMKIDVEGDASFVESSTPVEVRGFPEDRGVSTTEVVRVGAVGDIDDGGGSPGSRIAQGGPGSQTAQGGPGGRIGQGDVGSGKGGKSAVPKKDRVGAGALPSRGLEGARAQLPLPPRQRTAQIV